MEITENREFVESVVEFWRKTKSEAVEKMATKIPETPLYLQVLPMHHG